MQKGKWMCVCLCVPMCMRVCMCLCPTDQFLCYLNLFNWGPNCSGTQKSWVSVMYNKVTSFYAWVNFSYHASLWMTNVNCGGIWKHHNQHSTNPCDERRESGTTWLSSRCCIKLLEFDNELFILAILSRVKFD